MIDKDTKEFILSIAHSLEGVCDGARTVDCVGYNKMDAGRARRLVEEINAETDELKLEQILNDLRYTLLKYKEQIIRMGYDYDKLAKLHFVINQVVVHGDELRIYTAYNPDFVKELKQRAKTCYWNGVLRIWICKLTEGKSVAAIVQRYYPDALIPPIPDASTVPQRPLGKITVLTDYKIELATEYHPELVADIKALKKRGYDPATKKWAVFLNDKRDIDDIFALAKKYNLEMSIDVVAFLQKKSQEFSIKELSLEASAANLPELQKILRENVMIRRLKVDVLKELPEKQRNFVLLDPSPEEWKDYVYAATNLRAWLLQKTGGNIGAVMKSMRAEFLVKISELRQLVAKAKLQSVEEWIDNFLESTNEKLVIFAVHKEIVESILRNPKYNGIAFGFTGEEPPEYRQRIVDIFTNTQLYPKVRLFVATIATAGVGYNLQVANNVAIIELPWRPADLQQAEDRVHRIGQKNQVTIYYLLCANSIEEKLSTTLNEKMRVSSLALDKDVEESVMEGLIQIIVGSS